MNGTVIIKSTVQLVAPL